jgi:hypothetical protein
MPVVTYAQAEGILARLHQSAGKPQQKAFRARLKHLKRLGVPLGSHPGRGKKIDYTDEQLAEWVFCLELEECGLDPSVIVRLLKENRREIYTDEATIDYQHELLLVIRPSAIAADAPGYKIEWIRREGHRDPFQKLRSYRRCIVVNVTQLLRQMDVAAVQTDTEITRKRGR